MSDSYKTANTHMKVSSLSRHIYGIFIPRTIMLTQPPQHLQVSTSGCFFASVVGPVAPMLGKPLEDVKLPGLGCCNVRARTIQRESILIHPLHHLHMSHLCCISICPVILRTTVFSGPLQDLQVAS